MVSQNYAVKGQAGFVAPTIAAAGPIQYQLNVASTPERVLKNHLMDGGSHLAMQGEPANDNFKRYMKLYESFRKNPLINAQKTLQPVAPVQPETAQAAPPLQPGVLADDLVAQPVEQAQVVSPTLMNKEVALIGLTEVLKFLKEEMRQPGGMTMAQAQDFLHYTAQQSARKLVQDGQANIADPVSATDQALNPLSLYQLGNRLETVMDSAPQPQARQPSKSARVDAFADMKANIADKPQIGHVQSVSPKEERELKAIAADSVFDVALMREAENARALIKDTAIMGKADTVPQPSPVQAAGASGGMMKGGNEGKVQDIIAKAKDVKATQNAKDIDDAGQTHLNKQTLYVDLYNGHRFHITYDAVNLDVYMRDMTSRDTVSLTTSKNVSVKTVAAAIIKKNDEKMKKEADTFRAQNNVAYTAVKNDYTGVVRHTGNPNTKYALKYLKTTSKEIAKDSRENVQKTIQPIVQQQAQALRVS